jgi:hypothetical protein
MNRYPARPVQDCIPSALLQASYWVARTNNRGRGQTPLLARKHEQVAHRTAARVTMCIRGTRGSSRSRFRGEMTQTGDPHDGLGGKFLRQFHATLIGGAIRVVQIDV